MSWLKRLFGSAPEHAASGASMPQAGRGNRYERPIDAVSAGLQAWEAKDFERAELLLREGVAAYRRDDPADVHFALGRLGAFLLQQERVDEAAEVLEEAIGMGTDIPAIWFDYMDVMAQRRDINGLFEAASRLSTATSLGGVSADAPWEALALLWMSRRGSWSCRANGARRRPAGLRLAISGRSGSELVSRMRLWPYGRRPSTKAATTPRPPTGSPCSWNGGRSMPARRS